MTYLYIVAALDVAIIVLCTLDILLRTCVSDEAIDRWTDRIFR